MWKKNGAQKQTFPAPKRDGSEMIIQVLDGGDA